MEGWCGAGVEKCGGGCVILLDSRLGSKGASRDLKFVETECAREARKGMTLKPLREVLFG